MKEKIYTIPVMEAFNSDCECPLCILERKIEDDAVSYILGPSLMEPDGRIESNKKGFCRNHFEMLYNSKINIQGLSLIMETHLSEKNAHLRKIYEKRANSMKNEGHASLLKAISGKFGSGPSSTEKFIDEMTAALEEIAEQCTICGKIEQTMERYIDVIFYLWTSEKDFRDLFEKKKGFCLRHYRQLLIGAKKYLNSNKQSDFVPFLTAMQLDNMERVQKEVNWFTQKIDYRNKDASWGNSKDAVPRSIQKLTGNADLR